MSSTFSVPEVAAFFIALLNYGHKRFESNKRVENEKFEEVLKQVESFSKEITETKSKLSKIDLSKTLR